MNDCRNRLTVWSVFTVLIIATQIVSVPVRYSLSVKVPFTLLSLLLLVALQECFANWRCIKQLDTESSPEEIKNRIEFIRVWSKMLLGIALALIAAMGAFLEGFVEARYLIIEVVALDLAVVGSVALNPGLKRACVLLKNRNKYSEYADAIYAALLCNCFIVAIPYLLLSFQLLPILGASRRFYAYM